MKWPWKKPDPTPAQRFGERVLAFQIQNYDETDKVNSEKDECWLDRFEQDLLEAGAMCGRLNTLENILVIHVYDEGVNLEDIFSIIYKYNFKYNNITMYVNGQPSQPVSLLPKHM